MCWPPASSSHRCLSVWLRVALGTPKTRIHSWYISGMPLNWFRVRFRSPLAGRVLNMAWELQRNISFQNKSPGPNGVWDHTVFLLKCGTKSKQQHRWTTRGVIRCFLKKCVSPLGHPPSIFNETHRLDEKKIKNGAKEGQRWAQWDQTRTNGSQKRAPNCRPNEQQVSSQKWPHAQSGINWTIEKTESPGGQKQPHFVWLVANYAMRLKINQFTKLLD